MLRRALLLFLSILIVSCNSLETEVTIDPALQPYVDQFLIEAQNRGVNIDLQENGLIMQFEEDVSTADYSGICRYRIGTNEVGIDKEVWGRLDEVERDRLIYHELGHCVLDRGHRNDKFDNNIWVSLMRGDPLSGIELRMPVCYVWDRTSYYLDELFDEGVTAPEWITRSFSYTDEVARSEELLAAVDIEELDFRVPDGATAFELEVDFFRRGGSGTTNFLFGNDTEFNFILIDHTNSELVLGNDVASCMRIPFENEGNIKITLRQEGDYAAIFVNEVFVHAIPAFEELVRRVWKTGRTNILMNELNLWRL